MKEFLKTVRHDKTLLGGYMLSLLLLIIAGSYTAIFYKKLPPLIPLYNQLPWGERRLGHPQELFLILLIAFITLGSNFLFSSLVYKKIPLASRMLSISTCVVCFFALLFLVRTIELVR